MTVGGTAHNYASRGRRSRSDPLTPLLARRLRNSGAPGPGVATGLPRNCDPLSDAARRSGCSGHCWRPERATYARRIGDDLFRLEIHTSRRCSPASGPEAAHSRQLTASLGGPTGYTSSRRGRRSAVSTSAETAAQQADQRRECHSNVNFRKVRHSAARSKILN